ncbi:membrane protein [Mycolicibacterium madagascariense]|uniref:Membrane protein n=1 Tax=Mycolicibacterium madagascariense TaxID=212765 RepID=A0A7I7XLY0_9MYCO|nr:diiron oxygenase [Mycolicibacterium madagascariense]MCV7012551.1 diiron oxygenase [Mycolicibacterium madagascariense]BBZ30231.1 membrane protein [Mycolicibacterium madagascariense]
MTLSPEAVRRAGNPTREEFSERLLRGSVKKSYEPIVDIDWDAPLEPDKFFLPPKTVSLYGTPAWDAMTREEQIELSRQELVNTLSAGIWFENILNQALLRDLMHADPTARATHYALTEMGDETRHMVMFGRTIEKVGAKPMRPKRFQRVIINGLPLVFKGPLLWVAALVGEEIFDSLQRQMMDDPQLQPAVQRLMRIHVTEEARHIQFARDGLRKHVGDMAWWQRLWVANLHGVGGYFFRHLFSNPAQYRRVGLPGGASRDLARASAHRHDVQISGFAPLAAFLEEVGLMGPIARRMWRRSHFLPATPSASPAPAAIPAPSDDAGDDAYDGPATLRVGGTDHAVRVRLMGHLDPTDGRYHWRGTVFEALPDDVLRTPRVTLAIGARISDARLTEKTPWGTYSIVGEGAPPFA